jgi:hypothetical protein
MTGRPGAVGHHASRALEVPSIPARYIAKELVSQAGKGRAAAIAKLRRK